MAAPAALLDECMNVRLVGALTARGYDVTSVQFVGPRGRDDGAVLAKGDRAWPSPHDPQRRGLPRHRR